MMKNSAVLFKEVRSMKRNQTMLSYSTAKDIITSAKELKKVRSTKQIDINTFMENKNEKIKNIDEKLEVHQSEIDRNHQIIEELNHNFMNLKVHLDREKENTQSEEKKNKLLRDEIERTNKILRAKNSRIQELNKKVGDIEKENEGLKALAAKNDEYTKTINSLRSRIATTEENLQDLRGTISDKDREIVKYKEKIVSLQGLRAKEEETNGQLLSKDIMIGNLKQTINDMQVEKNRNVQERALLDAKIEKLTSEIATVKELNGNLRDKLEVSEKKVNQVKIKLDTVESQGRQALAKMKNKDKEEFTLKTEISELRIKNAELSVQIEEKSKQIGVKDSKLQKFSQKIKELQNNLGQNYKEKDKLKSFEDKIQILKKRLQNLQHLYYSIIPQIQCPFGHELNNPVTIIPCGHNYCLGCKKGYNKECMQCNGKLKIEAVYRNELMDDIIGMVGGIKQIIEILK